MNWFRIMVGVFLFGPCVLHAQNSKIYGKVVNSKNEPLHGATIVLDGKKRSTATDYNGAYTFSGLYAGVFVIKCSYTSYADKVIGGITVKPGEAVNVDFVMDEVKGKLKEVVVTSSARNAKPKESIASLIIAQKNSASVSDGISAESIKRTPDRNTSDVLKRISGASIQEDKFVIIRGLNDRYNAAFLNGATLPSSESDRKAFAFDIFPANMLDNLIIYKTATPDKPGEFAGGLIEVNTKGIPSQNFETFSIGTGFNTFATLQNGLMDKM
jgi:CarboxypepD_reg-like domain/TonB-dependent Receptor Plug Domain